MKSGVIWITGLSGVGKTTLATLLCNRLRQCAISPILLDGDALRAIMPHPLGYSQKDRKALAMFYSRLAEQLANQGNLVVCSTISLFSDVQARNRLCIHPYFEVLLWVSRDELLRRDTKGVYCKRPHCGILETAEWTPELPASPDLVINNEGDTTADIACSQLMAALGHPTEALDRFTA